MPPPRVNAMDDEQSELQTGLPEASTAKTVELPRMVLPPDKKEADFRMGQGKILRMISANAPLSQILTRLMLLIEEQTPGMLCSVLLLSEDGDHIKHGAAPSLPEDYVKAIDGAAIGPKNGSCGTAMYRGEPVVVKDILVDPLWEDYRELAAASGLRACWSTPIFSGRGKVLGSFAMYYRQPQTPTGDEASLTDVATHIAGLAIEHQRAREVLQRTQAELAQATWRATQATQGSQAAASEGSKRADSIESEEFPAPAIAHQLKGIARDAELCLAGLSQGQPDIARLRETLTKIATDARLALELITRNQSLAKK